MLNLLKSELFRMRKRPQTWLLLVVAALFMALFYGGPTVATFFANDANAADLKQNISLVDIRDFGLSLNSLFGGIMLAIFAAGLFGNEYSWNTIRPLLARARSRSALLTAKLSAALLYTVAFTFALAALTVLFSFISTMVAGGDWGFTGERLLDVVWYTFGLVAVNLPYVALAMLAAMWAKSNAAGIGVAIGLSILEPSLFGIFGRFSFVEDIQKGGLNQNTVDLLSNGLTSGDGWINLIVTLIYTGIFVALAYRVFLRRDVTSG